MHLVRVVSPSWVRSASAVLLAVVAFPAAARLQQRLDTNPAVRGSESAQVDDYLEERFRSPFARAAILVMDGPDAADSEAGRALVRSVVARIEALPFITGTLSPATSLDTLLIGRDHRGAIIVAGIAPGEDGGTAIDRLRAVTTQLHPVGVRTLEWTGELALRADVSRASAGEARRGELRAVPVSLLLALWAFAGVAGAFVGVAAGVTSVLLALGVVALGRGTFSPTPLTPSVATLLALALGVDYTLLTFRRGSSGPEATRAVRRTILIAGGVIAAAFVPLFMLPIGELRSAGLGAVSAVAGAVFTALWFVPAFANRGPARAEPAAAQRWRRWTRRIIERPWLALAAGLVPMLSLGACAFGLRMGLQGPSILPPTLESVRAFDTLTAMGRLESAMGLRVVLELPEGQDVLSPDGWAALGRYEDALRADGRVAAVRSIHTAAGGLGPATVRRIFPQQAIGSLVSLDGRAALLHVAHASPDIADAGALVADLRRRGVAPAGAPGARVLVGGLSAYNVDYTAALLDRAGLVLGLAALSCWVILFFSLRSVLLATKAIVLNAISVAAALGVITLVFQSEAGARLLGLPAPLDGIVPSIPLLVLCATFGVGLDYEVLLLARVAEERRAGASNEQAIIEGTARSADVIVRAAIVMIGVFAAFAVSDFVVLKILGVALAVAITLDISLIRLIAAPALLFLARRWNWWPGERGSAAARP